MVKGKTRAMVNEDVHDVKKNDLGYIDAYITAEDTRVYAVFVRESDGLIGLLALRRLRAVTDENDVSTETTKD